MKDWIMELCPEIAEWQAELIEEQIQAKVAAEREACARLLENFDRFGDTRDCAAAIRARGDECIQEAEGADID